MATLRSVVIVGTHMNRYGHLLVLVPTGFRPPYRKRTTDSGTRDVQREARVGRTQMPHSMTARVVARIVPVMTHGVWYAAYGSNLSPQRFAYYLYGGRPPGAARAYPGCRTPPDEMPVPRPLKVPGGVHFAGTSRVWGGGMAFFDPALPEAALMSAYPLTVDCFVDVAAQEMYLDPDEASALATDDLIPGRTLRLRPGRYGAIEVLGLIGGDPVVTVSNGDEPVGAATPPVPRYLDWIIRGLSTVHRLNAAVITRYLAGLTGVGRDEAALAAAVRAVAGGPMPWAAGTGCAGCRRGPRPGGG